MIALLREVTGNEGPNTVVYDGHSANVTAVSATAVSAEGQDTSPCNGADPLGSSIGPTVDGSHDLMARSDGPSQKVMQSRTPFEFIQPATQPEIELKESKSDESVGQGVNQDSTLSCEFSSPSHLSCDGKSFSCLSLSVSVYAMPSYISNPCTDQVLQVSLGTILTSYSLAPTVPIPYKWPSAEDRTDKNASSLLAAMKYSAATLLHLSTNPTAGLLLAMGRSFQTRCILMMSLTQEDLTPAMVPDTSAKTDNGVEINREAVVAVSKRDFLFSGVLLLSV